jgi:hypothetical protein
MVSKAAFGRPFSCNLLDATLRPREPAITAMLVRRITLLLLTLMLAGCAGLGPEAPPPPKGWHAVSLPGKEPTRYQWGTKDGRRALGAASERSASLWRRKVDVAAERLGPVEFAWWVDTLIEDASIADASREDAAARVLFAFEGDERKLPARTRAIYDLAEALTGERPPYATLMYVFETSKPVGTIVHGVRSDRVRKMVLDSGAGSLRQWRVHQRDLAADFRAAFGEDPGRLIAVAVMTDSDNTKSRAAAWYQPPTID